MKVVGISVLWLLGFIWVVFAVGMYIGTAIFSLVFLLVLARKKPIFSVVYTAIIVAALYSLEAFAELVAPVGWFF